MAPPKVATCLCETREHEIESCPARRREELSAAALDFAASLGDHDESGKCYGCRRRRDPRKPMESHRPDCKRRAYEVARDRS